MKNQREPCTKNNALSTLNAMNGAQLHLAINHFPVVISFLSLVLLLWAWRSGSRDLRKAALVFVIFGAFFSGIAYLTGEPAEDVLKKLPDYPKSFVHEHEEAAEWALIMNCISGVLAIGALYFYSTRQKLAANAFIAAVVVTILLCTIYLRVAHLGGLIKHTEIRQTISEQ